MRTPATIDVISAASLEPKEIPAFLNEVETVEKSAWPPELQASRTKFESRLNVFPEGFIALRVDGKIRAVTTSQVCTYDPSRSYAWDEVTDSGMIRQSHNSSGNALYVVSVGVSSDSQGMGLGGRLVQEQKELAKKLRLKYLFLGARIPGYADYVKDHGEISVEDYLKLANEKGEPVDPEIRFYKRQGLEPRKIIPDFEPDDESKGYGVVMVWQVSQTEVSFVEKKG